MSQQRGRGDFRGGRGGPGGPGRGTGGRGSPSGGRGSPSGGRGSPGGDGRGRGGPPRGGYGGGGQRGGFGGGGRGRGGAPEAPFIYLEGQPAVQAPRLAPDVAKKHIETLSKFPKQVERPFRPGYGTIGTPIVLRSNFFAVKLPKGPLFDYSVEIHPKVAAAGVKTRIFQLLEESAQCAPFRNYMAHNKSDRLITAKKLPQPLDISLEFHEEGEPRGRPGAKVYTVSVVFTRDLNMSEINNYLEGQKEYRGYDPLPIISALNLVLQAHASKAGVRAGASKYFFGPPVDRLGVGTEVWKGFFLSLRPAHKQLLVNVGACFTPFVSPGSMDNALRAFQSSTSGALPTLPPNIARSIKVVTEHLGYKRRYKVHSIMSTSARNTFFPCEEFNSKKMSVEEYLKRKYNITLKLADKLPVVNVGKRDRPVYIPAELCAIEPGNAYRGRLTDVETSNMINVAKNQPRVTAETIVNQGFAQLGLSPPAGPVQNFGLEIEPEMTVIPGRILPPPGLSYKTGRPNLRDGSWNIMDVTFQKSGRVDSWWVLIVQDGGREYNQDQQTAVQQLTREFAAKLKKNGIAIEDFQKKPPTRLVVTLPPPWNDPGRKQALKMIRDKFEEKLKTGPRPSFVLVILNNRDNYIYPGIKRIGDVELGVQTIHMQFTKASVGGNKADQYFSNVALKVNTKLGGMNHTLDNNAMSWLNKKPTMLVGIDVTHPGPGSQEGTPSIAAVVASVDKDFVQYPGSLRIQNSKKEMLDELTEMMIERIQLFQKRNKVPPGRIIVFRDGVSEGQFDTVVREELPQIKKAVTKINIQGYNPQISIIICGKRHHARFFPTNSQHGDKNGNTKAGTVVDKGVTAVFDFDFYLQAHAGLQGTVRPTHYTVVYDESSLSADDLQKGTNDASYLYARATKAVSLVPPAYYADLACERGRCYLNDFLVSDDGTSSAAGSTAKKEEAERVYNAAKRAWGQGLHPNMRETMFYI